MSGTPWTADIAIDPAFARNAIVHAFPQFATASIEAYGVGWDNAAFLVDGRFIFRFPRRTIAIPLLEREIALLPLIAPHVPLAIPAPVFIGRVAGVPTLPFAGYERIAGSTLCASDPSDAARATFAEPLARFLRALHALDPQPLVDAGLPDDEIGRLDHAKRLALTRERVDALTSAGALHDGERWLRWLVAHPVRSSPPAALCVVHGDLYARHVVIGDHGCITGIIDWGDLHRGDSAIDLALAFLVLPPAAYPAFRAAYGSIDDATWTAAQYRAIYHAFLELDYGRIERDAGMHAAGVKALAYLTDALGQTDPSGVSR